MAQISDEKTTVYETWSRDVVVFTRVLLLKVSSRSAIMQERKMRAHSINWLRDQLFEQGMIIYTLICSLQVVKRLGFMRIVKNK